MGRFFRAGALLFAFASSLALGQVTRQGLYEEFMIKNIGATWRETFPDDYNFISVMNSERLAEPDPAHPETFGERKQHQDAYAEICTRVSNWVEAEYEQRLKVPATGRPPSLEAIEHDRQAHEQRLDDALHWIRPEDIYVPEGYPGRPGPELAMQQVKKGTTKNFFIRGSGDAGEFHSIYEVTYDHDAGLFSVQRVSPTIAELPHAIIVRWEEQAPKIVRPELADIHAQDAINNLGEFLEWDRSHRFQVGRFEPLPYDHDAAVANSEGAAAIWKRFLSPARASEPHADLDAHSKEKMNELLEDRLKLLVASQPKIILTDGHGARVSMSAALTQLKEGKVSALYFAIEGINYRLMFNREAGTYLSERVHAHEFAVAANAITVSSPKSAELALIHARTALDWYAELREKASLSLSDLADTRANPKNFPEPKNFPPDLAALDPTLLTGAGQRAMAELRIEQLGQAGSDHVAFRGSQQVDGANALLWRLREGEIREVHFPTSNDKGDVRATLKLTYDRESGLYKWEKSVYKMSTADGNPRIGLIIRDSHSTDAEFRALVATARDINRRRDSILRPTNTERSLRLAGAVAKSVWHFCRQALQK